MKLIVIQDGLRSDHEFTQRVVTIGRAQDNDLPLNDLRVSRYHCNLVVGTQGPELIDHESHNGTKVNGEKVSRQILRPGDIIDIGKTRICYAMIPQEGFTAAETAVLHAAKNLEEETLVREVTRERDNLRTLQKINHALNSQLALRPLLDLIVDSALQLTKAERGFLILGQGENAKFQIARNFAREAIEMPELKVSHSITAKVRESGKPILSINAQEDERFKAYASVETLGLVSVICLPIRIHGKMEGILYVDNRLQKGIFSKEDLELLEAMCDQAAIALQNAHLFHSLQESNEKLQVQKEKIADLNARLNAQVQAQESELQQTKAALEREQGKTGYPNIIGNSAQMREVFRFLDRVIPTDFPVLIEGESGTGKELVAKAIHSRSPRKHRPFVTENCGALSDDLLESELFGHTKGAFTGAHKTRKGLLEIADGGTLFLDEVGEMSASMQKKLLRFLQEGEVRAVGSDSVVRTNVRVVSAANQNLEDLVRQGRFREDLFYRLNVLRVALPPLRARQGDLPMLVNHFMQRFAKEVGRSVKKIAPEVFPLLESYTWPGNIRELENEIRKWLILEGQVITPALLSKSVCNGELASTYQPTFTAGNLPQRLEHIEKIAIQEALMRVKGNKSRAAIFLGISRFALQRRIEKLNIEPG